jgi:iron complex transport system permease protein
MSEQQPKSKKTRRITPMLTVLVIITVAAALAALCIGRYAVSVSELSEILIASLSGRESVSPQGAQNVVWLIRLPRVIAALLVGSGLAVSGATYQSIFKNPLAAPELLGVFQGSSVGAAIAILLNLGNMPMQFTALAGGIAAVGLTSLVIRFFKSDSTTMLVLSGVIVSGLLQSMLGLLKYLMDYDTQLPAITFWQMGSLADITIEKVWMIGPTMLIAMAVLLCMRWQFNLLSLGDAEVRSLGVSLKAVRGVIILCSTLLASCAVCMSGTVTWVGLIIPYLTRMLVGPDNVRLIPVSVFAGAIFLVVIDTIGRTLSGIEIPLSILTGIIGAPGFILLISKQRMRVK